MGQWQHGGGLFVDVSVRVEAADRAGREWLLRHCARPPFALERLREHDPERVLYAAAKRGACGDGALLLTPPERRDHRCAPVPPRVHGHRRFPMLARNSPRVPGTAGPVNAPP